jgi:hypothetical protein
MSETKPPYTWRLVDPRKVYFETRGHEIVKVVEAADEPADEAIVDQHHFNPDARDPE